ncbi:hypothetical protein B0T26DRAFT_747215 [Lasiosphaeria miniovina]|uniref:Uncharacterized protein n=1 Tax=Lasiosphaeria miniovina TaxID=1954250 RepID=A0AA40B352_9PEZI|nr:uncharacterized protein B0T26DRAFT_747215 [Lasiosphaeria miniovina]KAK0726822.1 hypothetical protein B0T26DRAFT_747215 [Lasiosphaeria miniovina]
MAPHQPELEMFWGLIYLTEEINTATFNVFDSLISFWSNAIEWMHKNQNELAVGVESDFARSMNRVESSIQHLKDLAQPDSMSKMTLRDARFAPQDNMFSSPDLEEDVAQLSVVLLPQAVNNAAFYGRDILSEI